ncbi:hypothetical protein GTQ40_13445 [Flavobacteriaceae bacterium R38]|nr:hypothetical protein [Flavobacteriaceae bacterium R38]
MPHKLSLIKEQTINQEGWVQFANNPYDEGKIADITDNMGKLEVPVTSIPSPFAQIHLFETSFAFVNKSYLSSGNNINTLSGQTTYHKYISHCLDVFEILFCYETLKLRGKIDLEIWKKEELKNLANDHNPGIKTFADTIGIYINNYNNDSRFRNSGISNAFDEFVLVYLDNVVIAGTSPYTGFFTIGDELPKTLKSNYNNRYFFSNNEPLYKRSKEFQEFINIFFITHAKIAQSFKELYSYIKINRSHIQNAETTNNIASLERNQTEDALKNYKVLEINHQEISFLGGSVPFLCDTFDSEEELNSVKKSDYVIKSRKHLERPPLALLEGLNKKRWNYFGNNKFTKDIKLHPTLPIAKRKLPQSVIEYPWITRNDFLSKHLIQLDYDVNINKFWLPKGEVKNILLPITSEYFNFFTLEDLKEQITVKKLKLGAIIISLNIPVMADQGRGVITFERTYDDISINSIDNDDYGAIIKSSMAFGIYPFFKVSKNEFNDRYKILSYHLKGEEITYRFFREETAAPKSIDVAAKLHSRTRKDENYPCVSNYLDLTKIKRNAQGEISLDKQSDVTFDAINVSITFLDKNISLSSVLIPLMGEPIQLVDGDSAIAFDVGTSNSFVAIKTGTIAENLTTYKDKGNMATPDLVMLNAPVYDDGNMKDYDLDRVSPIYGRTQVAEFLPSLVGDDSMFKLPIRSIINIDNDTNPEKTNSINVLSNANIPFGFGQSVLRKDYDVTHSNIKWGVTDGTNLAAQNKLKAFIEQLIWLGRNKLLSEGFNPKASDVLWFKPLSMGNNQMTVFTDIWNELYTIYYNKNEVAQKLVSITESWAPFYSYDKTFGAGEVYMNLDIGGGTTDLIVFVNNKPELTSSFRFAGNSLFESHSGNDPFDNGFVTRYESLMRKEFGDDFTKTDIIDYIKNSKGLLSTDLISYFFSYNSFSKKLMLDSEFKLLFLLHNSSIFFHAIQILKISGITQLPGYIGVSGNGARLLEITNGAKDLNRVKGVSNIVGLIVKKIFEMDTVYKIEIQVLNSPKQSTAIGGIKGLDKIKVNPTADIENFYLSIGDGKRLINDNNASEKKALNYANFINESDTTINEVTQNVISFFDYFFDELWYEADFIKNYGLEKSYNPEKLKQFFSDASKISDTIREVINHKIEVEQESILSDSLFFDAIKSYLYAFSRIIASDKINQFKGI